MASLLQKAINVAVKAHRDGEDPPGEPYVVHVMRVMLAVSQADDAHQDERVTFRSAKERKDIPRVVRLVASYKFLTGQISENSYRKIMKHGES